MALGMAGVGSAIAQTTTPAPAQAPAAAPAPSQKPAEMKPKAAEAHRAKSATGAVKSASADSVVVAGKEKGQAAKDVEWTFAVDSKTAIRKAGKAITASDLKTGDHVNVRYTDQDGKPTAVAIQVRPSAPAAKSPAAEKK
jgi:Cu/Ag efflux protein CusF